MTILYICVGQARKLTQSFCHPSTNFLPRCMQARFPISLSVELNKTSAMWCCGVAAVKKLYGRHVSPGLSNYEAYGCARCAGLVIYCHERSAYSGDDIDRWDQRKKVLWQNRMRVRQRLQNTAENQRARHLLHLTPFIIWLTWAPASMGKGEGALPTGAHDD